MNTPALKRTRERWKATSPDAVAAGSPAQIAFYLRDAKADIESLCRKIDDLEQEIADHVESRRIEIAEMQRERREAAEDEMWRRRFAP